MACRTNRYAVCQRALSGTALILLLSGCASTRITQAETKALETRELDLGYDEAYKAAANGLFSLGFTIDHSDKASGIVSGKRRDPQTNAKIANALVFGVVGLLATGDREEGVTFMLTSLNPRVTELRMKAVVNGKPIVDREMMTRIWQQIEREAMLESRPSDAGATTRPRSPTSSKGP